MTDHVNATRLDVAGTAVAALVARLGVALLAWNAFPPADDGVFYDALARRLARGLGYTWAWPDGTVTRVAHYPVGYPALLALAYRVLGERPMSALLLHAGIGAVGAVAVHLVAARGTSRRAGRWAGLVVALHPALLAYTPAIMTEGVCAALLAVPFALALSARRRSGWAFLAGVALGSVSLVRPQALLLAPVVGWLAIAGASRRRWRASLVTLLFVTGVTGALAPWIVRNERVFGRAVLVSANGGWNLLIGTDERAAGGWRGLDVPYACRDVWDEAGKDACFGRAAREKITARPWAWIALAPSKLATTFDIGGSGASYLARSRPDLVPRSAVVALGALETFVERAFLLAAFVVLGRARGPRRGLRLGVAIAATLFLATWHAWPAWLGLAILVLLGGERRLAQRPIEGVTAAVLVATLLTHGVFFGAGRYALLVFPWVAALAAVGLASPPLLDDSVRPPARSP